MIDNPPKTNRANNGGEERLRIYFLPNLMTAGNLLSSVPSNDTLIDALRGCRSADDVLRLERRLAELPEAQPLFDWVCTLLVERQVSRGLAARLLSQMHHGRVGI